MVVVVVVVVAVVLFVGRPKHTHGIADGNGLSNIVPASQPLCLKFIAEHEKGLMVVVVDVNVVDDVVDVDVLKVVVDADVVVTVVLVAVVHSGCTTVSVERSSVGLRELSTHTQPSPSTAHVSTSTRRYLFTR